MGERFRPQPDSKPPKSANTRQTDEPDLSWLIGATSSVRRTERGKGFTIPQGLVGTGYLKDTD